GVRRELGELNDVMAEIVELATDSHQPPELIPVDLAPIVEQVSARFVRRTGRSLDANIEPIRVRGDADSLARATTNLLSNADKYSPEGAPVRIEAGPGGVFVDDAGPGIPPNERRAVLERFYRRVEDRSKPGSGLGLSIVASIVEQHGGQVIVTDSELGGARVGFRLPN
ncbi:MAG: ATP-binding protein, partial [Actinomycetota bacterium]